MGKSAASGPAWGAKQLLWTVNADNLPISTSAQTIAAITVPAGEDWFVTDVAAYRGSTGSTAFTLAVLDDSTTIADVVIGSSLASATGSTRPAPAGGEYAGVQVLTGSVLSVTVTNGNSSLVGSSGVKAWVYGFPRHLDSDTRGF